MESPPHLLSFQIPMNEPATHTYQLQSTTRTLSCAVADRKLRRDILVTINKQALFFYLCFVVHNTHPYTGMSLPLGPTLFYFYIFFISYKDRTSTKVWIPKFRTRASNNKEETLSCPTQIITSDSPRSCWVSLIRQSP